MSRFNNVLVFAEAADPACLERVVELVEANGCSLTICDVVEPAPQLPDPEGLSNRLQTVAWQRRLERLRRVCVPYMQRLEVYYTVLLGNPFVVITEQVVQQGFDLVVHISDAVANNSAAGLNPTGMHLTRKCPCPVLHMQAGATHSQHRLLLAVNRDLAEDRASNTEVALELLAAAKFALRPAASVHVVHAWQPFAQDVLDDLPDDITFDEAHNYLLDTERDYQLWLTSLMGELRATAPELEFIPHLIRGAAPGALTELANSIRPGLMVMGTIGSTKVPGVLIGTTAEAILSSTRVPVLAVKPRGFRTPLRFARVERESSGQNTTTRKPAEVSL